MSFIELLFISIGLAMDCFAVSFSAGTTQKNFRIRQILLLAFSFGFFQAAMPLIGWFGGEALVQHIGPFDHWIVFVILLFIGIKMIIEALRPNGEQKKINVMNPSTLLLLSVATSIDALAIGFGFSMLAVNIYFSIFLIGITSFILSVAGVCLGKKLSNSFKVNYAEIIGGIILVAIGTKILIEHLCERL